jgi:hypothetical protein
MKHLKTALFAALLLAGCDGNPISYGPDEENPDLELPPGTENPSPSRSIRRLEEKTDTGNGFAEGFTYDAEADTFSVDGLAFDGANVYARDNQVASLGPYAVYEGASIYEDDVTGTPIPQFGHRAIYGVSTTGNVEFAVVRTGAYIPYGFGGFVYERNGGVTLPTSGQANYAGDYAGLRDFNGAGGLEYVTGDMDMQIDFEDFNEGYGVQGSIQNRRIFDMAGNDITGDVLTALSTETNNPQTRLPVITFDVGPGVMDLNGELTGTLGSYVVNGQGEVDNFERGNYYAVLSGEGADQEVAGVIVIESADPRVPSLTVRETGGFILYRD